MSLLDWDPPAYRYTNVAPPVTWWTPDGADRAHAVLPDGSTACGHPRRDARWRPGALRHWGICEWYDARGAVI